MLTIVDGARHLAQEFSLTQEEWRQHFRGGDDLLEGLASRGYANHKAGRYAISAAGQRLLKDHEVEETDEHS